jgi:MOSC domain-containing protein YiiM
MNKKNAGKIVSICRSKIKKESKSMIKEGLIKKNWGLDGDAHAGKYHKQISLLSIESIKKMKKQGANIKFGDLFENLVVDGIVLHKLPIGTKLKIGEDVLLEITQIGKKEEYLKEIEGKMYKSIMTKEGVFTRVIEGGIVKAEDEVEVIFND